jgi:MFS family permease
MAGVVATSVVGGRIISRFGRYRPFPIIGTAVMTVGLGLLATLGVGTATWTACLYMLVLGTGLGFVMQVLVLAVQNAVDYRDLGVATSGTTLFRSIGGSVGVSLFGAIFTAALTANLAGRLPADAEVGRYVARRDPGAAGRGEDGLSGRVHHGASPCLSLRGRGGGVGFRAHLASEGTSPARGGRDAG